MESAIQHRRGQESGQIKTVHSRDKIKTPFLQPRLLELSRATRFSVSGVSFRIENRHLHHLSL